MELIDNVIRYIQIELLNLVNIISKQQDLDKYGLDDTFNKDTSKIYN